MWERAQRLHDKMKTNLVMAKDRLDFLGIEPASDTLLQETLHVPGRLPLECCLSHVTPPPAHSGQCRVRSSCASQCSLIFSKVVFLNVTQIHIKTCYMINLRHFIHTSSEVLL